MHHTFSGGLEQEQDIKFPRRLTSTFKFLAIRVHVMLDLSDISVEQALHACVFLLICRPWLGMNVLECCFESCLR